MTMEFEGLPNKIFNKIESYDFNELIGCIITDIIKTDAEIFLKIKNRQFAIMHMQDCCEDVYIEDVTGNLDHLLNYPLIMCESCNNNRNPKTYHDTATWTVIKLATIKGYVTIRFCGDSDGCYCEDANLYLLKGEEGE
jgi:hypothetical protein